MKHSSMTPSHLEPAPLFAPKCFHACFAAHPPEVERKVMCTTLFVNQMVFKNNTEIFQWTFLFKELESKDLEM